jgi:hypothetical protein
MLTHAQLLNLIIYIPEAGRLFWRANGPEAGHLQAGDGTRKREPRWRVTLDGHNYSRAKVAWFYMTGTWPTHDVDHRDTDSLNDKWVNLRAATRSQQQANTRCYKSNKFGLKGVHRRETKIRPYRAMIQKDGHRISLGAFETEAAAFAAYTAAATQLHGEFARF